MPTKFDAGEVAHIHEQLHSHLPSESALRVKALETLLVDKGLVNPQTIDACVQVYSEEIGPRRGAHIVARAWSDADYRRRLLQDAPAAMQDATKAQQLKITKVESVWNYLSEIKGKKGQVDAKSCKCTYDLVIIYGMDPTKKGKITKIKNKVENLKCDS